MDLLHSQYQALLEISEAIASHRDLDQLFHDLTPRLHRVLEFDFANLILYEPGRQAMKSHVLETPDPNYTCPPGECPMETPGRLGARYARTLGGLRSWERHAIPGFGPVAWRSRNPIALCCSRHHRIEETGCAGLWQQSGSRLFRYRCDFLTAGSSTGSGGSGQRAQLRTGAVGSATTQGRTRSFEPAARGEQYGRFRA